jgi:gluconate 2-dehydrogenase gamma chain
MNGLAGMQDPNRRTMLAQLAGIGLMALPSGVMAASGSEASHSPSAFLSASELRLLTALADTIIPATDTPGAVAANVPDTLHSYLIGWASADTRGRWRTNLALLAGVLDLPHIFHLANRAEREQRLAPLDAAIFADPAHKLAGYRDMKSVIVTAYYLSKPGATVELDYLPVPGDWQPDIPVRKNWAA